MKVECIHCHLDLSKKIQANFEQFECGKVICPHCKKEQKRYISEADLLIYFGFSAVLYCLLLSLVFLVFNLGQISVVTLVLIAILFVIGYFLMKQLINQIYLKAFFKKDLQFKVIEEDAQVVKKRLKWQFMMFMLIALMMSTQPDLIFPFLFMIVAFIIIVMIKVTLSIKKERNQ